MQILVKTGVKCRQSSDVKNRLKELSDIPDEEALCLINPNHSCVTCQCVNCPDFGTRFASCPEHLQKEKS